MFSGPASFYLPDTFVDPFGNSSSVDYDACRLVVLQATEPLGNTVTAKYDYRVLAPVQVTEANGNRAEVQLDELGRVVATAVMGKAGDADGDTLADPTTTFAYDLTRFATTGQPNVVSSRAREQHGAATTRWQEVYSYSDGSGHEVMRKIPAEPGLAPARASDGSLVHDSLGALVFVASAPRWVGTGRTVFDNKGNPVKQYGWPSPWALWGDDARAAGGTSEQLRENRPTPRLAKREMLGGADDIALPSLGLDNLDVAECAALKGLSLKVLQLGDHFVL